MYGYEWANQNGIYRLSLNSKIEKEIRPVFKDELDYFGFNEHWKYPTTKKPLLWAEGIRRYVLNGNYVAQAVGGGFYTKPTIKFFSEDLKLEPIRRKFFYICSTTKFSLTIYIASALIASVAPSVQCLRIGVTA